jgi:hypothetical protein
MFREHGLNNGWTALPLELVQKLVATGANHTYAVDVAQCNLLSLLRS